MTLLTVRGALRRAALVALLGFSSLSSGENVLVGKVVKVADGDTLTVLDASKRQRKVRLRDIDAPEKGQAFGKRSRQSLAAMCAGVTVSVEWREKDRYGRLIGDVTCGAFRANEEQVNRGMAGVFRRYASPTSAMYPMEAEAKRRRAGLWSDAHPVPPWDWRARKRASRAGNSTSQAR